jgi:hypothetical protein
MKHLIKQYLDQGLSRRQLVSGLSALGMSTVAAKAVAQNLSPLGQGGAPGVAAAAPAAIRDVEGNGGALFVAQLKAAGVEHIFFNPSTGDHPIFDALVDVLPPPKPVSLPDGHGKELVETHCGLCHDLERVATGKRAKRDWPVIVNNMVAWGAPASPEDAKIITDYLTANFGN